MIFTKGGPSQRKIGTLMASFRLKFKMYELKMYRGFCVMSMKNDTKFEEELTCQFKVDTKNLTNFDPSTRKSQKFTLRLVLMKVCNP